MQTRRFTRLPGMVLAVMLTLLVGLGIMHNASAGKRPETFRKTLSGTWNVNVTLTDCQSGMPLPIPRNPFPALNTFLEDGTLLETGSLSPYRSPGHGHWERTGHNRFLTRFIFFRFAADGTYLGTQEVTRTIHLVAPDAFTATATVELFDVNGNPAGRGCATETATLFE